MALLAEARIASVTGCLYKTQCVTARKPDIPHQHWSGTSQSRPEDASGQDLEPREIQCSVLAPSRIKSCTGRRRNDGGEWRNTRCRFLMPASRERVPSSDTMQRLRQLVESRKRGNQ